MMKANTKQRWLMLLLLVLTGQSLAGLLAPCMMPASQPLHDPGAMITSAAQPIAHEPVHHHAMTSHLHDHDPAGSANHVSAMDMSAATSPATTPDPSSTVHPDHNCCHGFCACIAMGGFSQAANSCRSFAISGHNAVLVMLEISAAPSPFLSPALRPPIRLA
jgi:hypothetical protein